MQNEKAKAIIERLLNEIEEEDVGLSLFLNCYQDEDELKFFKESDRERVCKIFKIVSDDSRRHKEMLEKMIVHLGGESHEK